MRDGVETANQRRQGWKKSNEKAMASAVEITVIAWVAGVW
jgi:hypothetical protein